MKKVKQFLLSLLSRKFILSVVAGVVAFGNSYFGWGMKIEEVVAVIIPLLGFILIEGYGDAKYREYN